MGDPESLDELVVGVSVFARGNWCCAERIGCQMCVQQERFHISFAKDKKKIPKLPKYFLTIYMFRNMNISSNIIFFVLKLNQLIADLTSLTRYKTLKKDLFYSRIYNILSLLTELEQ